MISEDTKRIKIGDIVYIWSEQSGHNYVFYVHIIIRTHAKEFRIVPITDDCLSEIQTMKKSIVTSRESYEILANYHDYRRRYYDHMDISRHYISWYELENSINIE